MKCPHCRADIAITAKTCPWCGCDVKEETELNIQVTLWMLKWIALPLLIFFSSAIKFGEEYPNSPFILWITSQILWIIFLKFRKKE